jgi:hypothetical protein
MRNVARPCSVLVVLGLGLSACGITIHFGSNGTTTSTAGPTEPVTTSPANTGGTTTTSSGGTVGNGVPAGLVGDWLGPFPSGPGKCNSGNGSTEYGEWWFYGTGSYTFTSNSEPLGTVAPPPGATSTSTPLTTPGCGIGLTLYGKFSVQGDVITVHQQADPGCPPCQQTYTFSFEFSLLSHVALKLCDNTAGLCWTYYRQPN